jgi:hypothetical protein
LKLLGYLPDRLRLNVYLNKIALLSVLTSLTARIAAIKNEKTGTLFYNDRDDLNRVLTSTVFFQKIQNYDLLDFYNLLVKFSLKKPKIEVIFVVINDLFV